MNAPPADFESWLRTRSRPSPSATAPATAPLLARVSGISPALATAVIARRRSQGLFRIRAELLQVPRFRKKAYEPAPGFLRIPGGEHPPDGTGIHPERYAWLEDLANRLGLELSSLLGEGAARVASDSSLREQAGEFTFADVGVHHDGLVHVAQLSDRFVRNPKQTLRPGMRVQVRVLEVNLEKKQVALTMKSARVEPPRPPRRRRAAPRPRPTQARAGAPPRDAAQSAPAPKQRPTGTGVRFSNNPFAALAGLKKDLKGGDR